MGGFLQSSVTARPEQSVARKPTMSWANLAPGSVIKFSAQCPQPGLMGAKAAVQSVRTYRFGGDTTVNFQLTVREVETYFLTVAEDDMGYYLAISRELDAGEQDRFFGKDALGFFTEPSSAKTIRCKADLAVEGAWLGARYSKTVDWVEGSVALGRPNQNSTRFPFHYNLLVDESGEKALELECYDTPHMPTRVYATVYRPVEDVESIAEPLPFIPVPEPVTAPKATAPRAEVATPSEPAVATNGTHKPEAVRTDFRRLTEEDAPIHVARARVRDAVLPPSAEAPPLPSFLTSRENNYLSLDEIITPETERVRVDIQAAKILIDTALKRRVQVREVMRELLGLESAVADEALFELPLTESDYRQLAQRYRLKPDRRPDIRTCLQEELRLKLLSIVKN